MREVHWVRLHSVRASIRRSETVFALGHPVVLYLNVCPGGAVHRLSLSHDNAAVARLLGESGGFGGLSSSSCSCSSAADTTCRLPCLAADVRPELEMALAHVDTGLRGLDLALRGLRQVVPRELPLIARLVVDRVPAEVVMGHSITCDAVFLRQNLRLTSL